MSNTLSLIARRATMMSKQSGGGLPSGYTQYDWVESSDMSTGSKINTGLTPNDATWRFDGSFARTQDFGSNYTQYFIFSRDGIDAYSQNFSIGRGAKNYDKIVFSYASVRNIERNCGFSSQTIEVGTWYDFSLHNTDGVSYGGTLDIGGETDSFETITTQTKSVNLFIFCGYLCRLGRFKIYNSDVLVADLVPCTRDADSAVGFYDVVRSMFLTSDGDNPLLTCGNGLEDFSV